MVVGSNNINWSRLVSALNFYNASGWKQIDLEWIVDSDVSSSTKPSDKQSFFIGYKELVASGEQSFIQLIKEGKLLPGRYCGITPCFRDDDEDYLHSKYFMKVELIDTLNTDMKSLEEIIYCAKQFFSIFLDVRIEKIEENLYDIVEFKTGFELGSYGIREYNNLKYVFGTGLAEPRLSKVLKLNNDNVN
jgi:seryl-tRNA synthetase